MVRTIRGGATNKEHTLKADPTNTARENSVDAKPIEAYDGGMFLNTEQPTNDNHGPMGQDSSGRVKGRWDSGARVEVLGMQR